MPTPLDIARRATSHPAPLVPLPPFRALYERGVRQSGMRPNCRLVALTVATYSAGPAAIPAHDQPGLNQLAKATGLETRGVRGALRELQQLGWITRPAGTRAPEHGHMSEAIPITLTIPPYARTRLGLPPLDATAATS